MNKNIETYDIYHDESKFDAYWHCFLFIPRSKKEYLISLLQESRNYINFQSQIRFGSISKKQRETDGKVMIAKSWLSIICAGLLQQKLLEYPAHMFFGKLKRQDPEYRKLLETIGIKAVIFKERDNHELCYFVDDPIKNIETTFRMGLKGGIHRLFPSTTQVKFGKIFIDGDEHYYGLYDRNLSYDNIVGRIILESRDHILFEENFKIIAQNNDHRKIKDNQNQEDSHLLQLADLFLGAIRQGCIKVEKPDVRYLISKPYHELLEYDINNYAGMMNSRYFNGFLFGEAWIDDSNWSFANLELYQETDNTIQSDLFGS